MVKQKWKQQHNANLAYSLFGNLALSLIGNLALSLIPWTSLLSIGHPHSTVHQRITHRKQNNQTIQRKTNKAYTHTDSTRHKQRAQQLHKTKACQEQVKRITK